MDRTKQLIDKGFHPQREIPEEVMKSLSKINVSPIDTEVMMRTSYMTRVVRENMAYKQEGTCQ